MSGALFVCVQNTGRSQMAETIFNRIAEERDLDARALSAGTGPAGPGGMSIHEVGEVYACWSVIDPTRASLRARDTIRQCAEGLDRVSVTPSPATGHLGGLARTRMILESLEDSFEHKDSPKITSKLGNASFSPLDAWGQAIWQVVTTAVQPRHPRVSELMVSIGNRVSFAGRSPRELRPCVNHARSQGSSSAQE